MRLAQRARYCGVRVTLDLSIQRGQDDDVSNCITMILMKFAFEISVQLWSPL